MIKLFAFDIDGCLNNGKKFYNENGLCAGKFFCDKDWSVLKRLKARDIKIHAITGDPWNENLLLARNIPYTITRSEPKENLLSSLLTKYGIDVSEMAYIGDDIFDLNLLEKVGYPFCPKDAISFDTVKNIHRLNSNGGDNIMVEIFNFFIKNKLIKNLNFNEEMEKVMDLDKNEKF